MTEEDLSELMVGLLLYRVAVPPPPSPDDDGWKRGGRDGGEGDPCDVCCSLILTAESLM